MVAAQRQLVAAAEAAQLAVHPHPQHVVGAEAGDELLAVRPVGPARQGGEPAAPGPAAQPPAGQLLEDPGVVGAQQRRVVGRLVLEDAQLGVHVGAVGAVPVEVVLREVEEDGHRRPEPLDVLELEARELGDHRRVRRDLAGHAGQGVADVAADGDRQPASRKTAPVSSVVVVLPLVPVMPTTGLARKRPANSTSLHTGTPRRSASWTAALVSGTPGLLTSRPASPGSTAAGAGQDLDPGGREHLDRVVVRRRALVEGDDARRRQLTPRQQRRRPAGPAQAEHGEAAHVGELHHRLPQKVA